MKWILNADRTVPDFRDPYLENIFYELQTLCIMVLNPEGTRSQYLHNIKAINEMLPIVRDICLTLRSATPMETIETEVEICAH